jgi:hypothetical protein
MDDFKAVATKVVEHKLGMFSAFRGHIGRDDLISEAMMAMARAQPRYDPKRAAFSTFFYGVGARRLIDVWRHWARHVGYEQKVAKDEIADIERIDEIEHLPLHEWLANVYAAAQSRFPGNAWYCFTRAQAFTVAAGLFKTRTSVREFAFRLSQSIDLRTALDLPRPPSVNWVQCAKKKHERAVMRLFGMTGQPLLIRAVPVESGAPEQAESASGAPSVPSQSGGPGVPERAAAQHAA